MYTYHFDHPNQQWNIFYEIDRRQLFIKSVKTVKEAQDFCEAENAKELYNAQ